MHEITTPHLPKLPRALSNENKTRERGEDADLTDETIITRAVKVQRIIVSKKTSKIPRQACECALSLLDEAWAEGEVPEPASFDKRPRLVPYLIASLMVNPNAPEIAGRKLKADLKILIKADGKNEIFLITIIKQRTM